MKRILKPKPEDYYRVHRWLRYHFGEANICENPNCLKQGKYFSWSLLRGFNHAKCREKYWMLCRSCHHRYDHTPEWSANISKGKRGRLKKISGDNIRFIVESYKTFRQGMNLELSKKFKITPQYVSYIIRNKDKILSELKN